MSYNNSKALEFLLVLVLACLSLNKSTRTLPIVGTWILIHTLIKFALTAYNWHLVNRFVTMDENGGSLPPQYPSAVPYLGSALSFIWNNAKFIRQAT